MTAPKIPEKKNPDLLTITETATTKFNGLKSLNMIEVNFFNLLKIQTLPLGTGLSKLLYGN